MDDLPFVPTLAIGSGPQAAMYVLGLLDIARQRGWIGDYEHKVMPKGHEAFRLIRESGYTMPHDLMRLIVEVPCEGMSPADLDKVVRILEKIQAEPVGE